MSIPGEACACGWRLPVIESPANGTIIAYRCGNCGANHVTTCGRAPAKKIGETVARHMRARALVHCVCPAALRVYSSGGDQREITKLLESGGLLSLEDYFAARTPTTGGPFFWCSDCGTLHGAETRKPGALATLEALLYVAEAWS